MRRIATGMMMLAFGLMVAGARAVAPQDEVEQGQAVLHVLNKEVDFGGIPKDTVAEGILRIQNTGQAPLVINTVHTDCGCTVASYSKAAIAPDSISEIKVRFNSKGRLPGKFRKIIRIRSNASNPTAVAFVVGHVKQPLYRDK